MSEAFLLAFFCSVEARILIKDRDLLYSLGRDLPTGRHY